MKRTLRDILFTYAAVLAIASMGFLVRWLSGKFSLEFNGLLFGTSIIFIGFTWELLRAVNAALDRWLPFDRGIPVRLAVQLGIGIGLAMIIRFAVYKFGEPYLPVRLDSMFLASTWAIYALVISGVNAGLCLGYFMQRWKDSLVRTERLEKEKAQIQFDNLKNQLNPHFLFNALTSLNSLISENQALASRFLQHLSKIYRYVLQNKGSTVVSLQTELDFIANYVFLAETRFGEALKITLQIDPKVADRGIVPVTLQVIIENALKHNIIDRDKPLAIALFVEGDYLVVRNNLQRRKTVETSNRLGLENLRSLYRFMTDRPVRIEENEKSFAVMIPLL